MNNTGLLQSTYQIQYKHALRVQFQLTCCIVARTLHGNSLLKYKSGINLIQAAGQLANREVMVTVCLDYKLELP